MQPTVTVSLDQLRNKKYASVLCYPKYTSREATRRIRQLKRLGVEALRFAGEKTAFNLPVLGKGTVGIVVIARTKTGRVALKVRRVDADRERMEHEAEMLAKANSVGVGPRLSGFSEDFLLMEFLEGKLLPKWVANLSGRGAKKRIRRVLTELLEQCWKLDEAGLDHGELSRAPKHVIIDSENEVHVVDFETASIMRRTGNVTSICQYLFLGSGLAKTLRKKISEIDNEALLAALRDYKSHPTRQGFMRILQTCKLA